MHLLDQTPLAVDARDHDRGKHAGDAGGGEQDLAEQLHRLFPALAGQQPHVPDHRLLRIEIGRHDQQPPALVMFDGDLAQQFRGDIGLNQILQHAGAEQAGRRKGRETAPAQQPARAALGIGAVQFVVPFGAEEGEGRRQRPGADAGDHAELGPGSTLGPAHQNPGPIGAIGPAAGQGEDRPALGRGPQAVADLFRQGLDPVDVASPDAGIVGRPPGLADQPEDAVLGAVDGPAAGQPQRRGRCDEHCCWVADHARVFRTRGCRLLAQIRTAPLHGAGRAANIPPCPTRLASSTSVTLSKPAWSPTRVCPPP